MTNDTGVGRLYGMKFSYDPKGRRIQKLIVSNNVSIYTNTFLYDGWNLVSILNSPSSIFESFLLGNDLSGSMQGAGGVGGLLESVNYGVTTNFVAYDGNGDVAALVDVNNGAIVGNLDYGPFGEPIRLTGTAKNEPIRFSTEYDDDESDLLYYDYSYYKPSIGTWPNRDTSGESGFELILDGKGSNPELERLLETGLHKGNRNEFSIWLNELERRKQARLEPYKRGLVAVQERNALANSYNFNKNNPVDNFDGLGLYIYNIAFPCPNPCCPRTCVNQIQTVRRFPRNPLLLGRCLQGPITIMIGACAICSSSGFEYGCAGQGVCLWLYW
ncbi:MAG TPA: RHS repeat-associated core domain-containing protein [Verrucomicrobiae bacterium]